MPAVKKQQARQSPVQVPVQVAGQVIGTSLLKMIAMMVVMTFFFFLGLGLTATWFVKDGLSIWALIMGLFLLVICPLAVALGVHQLKIKERLIVGADRFQVVHRLQGEDKVVTQIPYANISAITYTHGTQQNHVGIDLSALDEPGTFEKNNAFETNKQINGFHYVIHGGYTEDLGAIYGILKGKLEAYEARQSQRG
jgi:hypothetical protein